MGPSLWHRRGPCTSFRGSMPDVAARQQQQQVQHTGTGACWRVVWRVQAGGRQRCPAPHPSPSWQPGFCRQRLPSGILVCSGRALSYGRPRPHNPPASVHPLSLQTADLLAKTAENKVRAALCLQGGSSYCA